MNCCHRKYLATNTTHLFGGQPLLLKKFRRNSSFFCFGSGLLFRCNSLLFQLLLFHNSSFFGSNSLLLNPSLLFFLCLLFGINSLLLQTLLLPEVLLGGPGQLDALILLGLHETFSLGTKNAILFSLIELVFLPLELGLLGGGSQPLRETGGLLPELVGGLPGSGRQTLGQAGLFDGLPFLFGQSGPLELETGGGFPFLLDPLLLLKLVPGGLNIGLG